MIIKMVIIKNHSKHFIIIIVVIINYFNIMQNIINFKYFIIIKTNNFTTAITTIALNVIITTTIIKIKQIIIINFNFQCCFNYFSYFRRVIFMVFKESYFNFEQYQNYQTSPLNSNYYKQFYFQINYYHQNLSNLEDFITTLMCLHNIFYSSNSYSNLIWYQVIIIVIFHQNLIYESIIKNQYFYHCYYFRCYFNYLLMNKKDFLFYYYSK